MTKKDYAMVAEAIYNRRSYPGFNSPISKQTHKEGIDGVAQNLVVAFEKDDPRFDRDRFLIACGLSR